MKLIYKDYGEDSGVWAKVRSKFKISGMQDYDDGETSDKMLEKFKENSGQKMAEYYALVVEEREIINKRKELLKNLRDEFSEFSKENYPELYL